MSGYAPFAEVQKRRPDWDAAVTQTLTKTLGPLWSFGQGATDSSTGLMKKHVEIDPFAEGRLWYSNYTLLISGIVPRPIGFVSTKSEDGNSDNLSPFSYFQVVGHDPPVFVIGFTRRAERPKDTLRNLMETRECTINVVSEHFIEAVNACSVDAPHGVSEWTLSGLHQAPSTSVKPARVQESIFSIEGNLIEIVNFKTSKASHNLEECHTAGSRRSLSYPE
jgi:flavin reductase (DIM6/NTAB) family NADH-FMN oxidoreductase RutF